MRITLKVYLYAPPTNYTLDKMQLLPPRKATTATNKQRPGTTLHVQKSMDDAPAEQVTSEHGVERSQCFHVQRASVSLGKPGSRRNRSLRQKCLPSKDCRPLLQVLVLCSEGGIIRWLLIRTWAGGRGGNLATMPVASKALQITGESKTKWGKHARNTYHFGEAEYSVYSGYCLPSLHSHPFGGLYEAGRKIHAHDLGRR